ncbi:MAG: hypothetical protein IJX36_06310 [Thermoguttaceae bacterium]|nr:hypothetical protein [Thermoguttaceae bacterium]
MKSFFPSILLRFSFVVTAVFLGLCTFGDYAVAADVSISPDAPPVANAAKPTPTPRVRLDFKGQRNADGDYIRPFTDADLAKIEATQVPFSLSFTYSDVDDADLERLAGNPFVRDVTLHHCPNLTDAAVEILARFPNLERAVLLRFPQWKRPNFAALSNCKQLHSLTLQSCNSLSEESLNGVAKCASLRWLELTLCPVADANLAQIAKLSALRSLHIKNCPTLTDAGIAEIAKLTELNSLMLEDVPELSDAGVAPLSGLSRLSFLAINGCPRLTKKGLASFSALPIATLSAPEQFFSDENIDALTQFPQVRVLFVRRAPNAKITLDGVLKLKALKELRGVFAEECSTAEVDAFKAAQRELPRLGVVVTLADAPEHKNNVTLPPLQRDAKSSAR